MPSRIAKNKSNEKEFDPELKESNQNEHFESLEPEASIEIRDADAHSLLVLPDQPELDQESILADDGYIQVGQAKVLPMGMKIHNLESQKKVVENEGETDPVGKKGKYQDTSSLKTLRKQFGFSWKKMSRKLALFTLVIGILLVAVVSGMAAIAIDRYNNTPSIDNLLSKPKESSVVYARDGTTKIFEFFEEGSKREIIEICNEENKDRNCMPENIQMAIVALEDENFFQNESGIPWTNIVGAAYKCILSVGDECRGGSGLAQQLVKNVTNKKDASLDRKLDELFAAIKLAQDNKDPYKIIELYLNWVPFGRNTYGIQAASKNYFGKDIKDVNLAEACFLASFPQQPSYFPSSIGNPESDAWKDLLFRKNFCLEKLRVKNLRGDAIGPYIKTDEELAFWQNYPAQLAVDDADAQRIRASNTIAFLPNRSSDEFPHFREFITEELRKIIPNQRDLYTRGYQIITTLDPVKQRDIEKIVRDSEKDNVIANGGNNAAAMVLDGPTGEIITMVGSLGYNRLDNGIAGQNNIMSSPQQPGSSIKPYVYAAALNKGFNPATVLVDVSTEFLPGYRPRNFDNSTQGAVNLRYSLQNSLNIPAVKTACLAAGSGGLDCDKGITEVFNFAEKTGLRFACYPPVDNFSKKDKDGNFIKQCNDPELARKAYRDRCGLASSLGGCEVVPYTHATGINTLLQEGNLRTAVPFISIKDKDGNELFNDAMRQQFYPREDKAIDPLIAKQMVNIMSDYNARRPKFGQFARNLEVSECGNGAQIGGAAAKTGTTNDVKDTWTVGGCTNYTAVVWVGRTDNEPMKNNASSSNAAAPVWNRVMKYLEKGQKPAAFSTQGLVRTNLDPSSGLIGGGSSELLTPSQRKILEDVGVRASNPEYNAKSKNIFDFRSSVFTQEIQINRLDGKLATALTLPENIEKKICVQLIPEFPTARNWADPVNSISSRFPDRYCTPPTESSPQDQVAERAKAPTFSTNLDTTRSNVKNITVNASAQGDANKSIARIEILEDGNSVSSVQNSPSLEFSLTGKSGTHTILIRVTDNFGAVAEREYTNVSYFTSVSSELKDSDLALLTGSCSEGQVSTPSSPKTTSCVFNMPSNRILTTSMSLAIGSETTLTGICTASATQISCTNVPTGNTTGTAVSVFARLAGGSKVELTPKAKIV